jgi:hypothetical protein
VVLNMFYSLVGRLKILSTPLWLEVAQDSCMGSWEVCFRRGPLAVFPFQRIFYSCAVLSSTSVFGCIMWDVCHHYTQEVFVRLQFEEWLDSHLVAWLLLCSITDVSETSLGNGLGNEPD